MGYSIDAIDDSEPPPKRLRLKLKCDGHHHALPLIPRTEAIFDEPGIKGFGYMELRRDAQKAGWRWVDNGRVLGPCCPKP